MKYLINTGNQLKFSLASGILRKYSIEAEQVTVEVPEIQAFDGKETCEFKAKSAFEILKKPVVTTDVGYYIDSLNGFPGPYIKYVNQWLSADDLLRLMEGKKDRSVRIVEYVSLVIDENNIQTFSSTSMGRISLSVDDYENGSTVDKVLIREGFAKPQNMLSKDELRIYLEKNVDVWHQLAKYTLSSLKRKNPQMI